jgi:Putative secretion activating protein
VADFNKAHLEVMGNEGGYVNNPDDAGGETYKGIARKFWPSWSGWKLIDDLKRSLPLQPRYGSTAYRDWARKLNAIAEKAPALQRMVLDFYLVNFWEKFRCGEILDQKTATWLYDHVVNGGARGAQWMQEAAGVTADGDIGPKSIAAINSADPVRLLQGAKDVAAFYRLDRAAANPSQIQFLPSWLRRDGVSEAEIREVMQAAKDGLTYTEVVNLKQMIKEVA